MTLATVEDYERLTGTDVPDGAETDRIQALLDVASAAVQGATGQTIERARTTEVVCLDWPRPTLVLDEVPLIEGEDPDTLVVRGPDGEVVPRDHYTALPKTSELKHCRLPRVGRGRLRGRLLARVRPDPGGPRRARRRLGQHGRRRSGRSRGSVGRELLRDVPRGSRDRRPRGDRRAGRREVRGPGAADAVMDSAFWEAFVGGALGGFVAAVLTVAILFGGGRR